MTYYYRDRADAAAPPRDALDRVLAAAWVAAEIAFDVFGLLFWSALGLFLLRIATRA